MPWHHVRLFVEGLNDEFADPESPAGGRGPEHLRRNGTPGAAGGGGGTTKTYDLRGETDPGTEAEILRRLNV